MSEILQSRYDQLLRRVADLKGQGSKVSDALTELFPMIDVENVPTELLVLSGTRMTMGFVAETAQGGTFSQAMLRVAGLTGVVATIHALGIFTPTAQSIGIGPSLNTLSTAGAEAFTDTRVFGAPTVGKVLSERLAAAGPTFFQLEANGTDGLIFYPPKGFAVVTPGAAFSVTTLTGATAIDVSFLWSERVAQPSELNL